jgi:CheY-like chemotaxis protein
MMKILYVEDNPVNLSLIQRIAQMNKHELTSYDEAEIALKALAEGLQTDLILLDIQLAGEMDGIDFAKEARKRGMTQPIIAITAYAMMGDKERIIEAGCNDYLPKPLPIAEFLTLLAKYDPALRADATSSATPPTAATTPSPVATSPTPIVATPTAPMPAPTIPSSVATNPVPAPSPVAAPPSSTPASDSAVAPSPATVTPAPPTPPASIEIPSEMATQPLKPADSAPPAPPNPS